MARFRCRENSREGLFVLPARQTAAESGTVTIQTTLTFSRLVCLSRTGRWKEHWCAPSATWHGTLSERVPVKSLLKSTCASDFKDRRALTTMDGMQRDVRQAREVKIRE